ncbi:MAG: hypothetical protein ACR2PR_08205 [Pseudohongiellaceae bacterium]
MKRIQLLLALSVLSVTALTWAHEIDPAQRVQERPLQPDGHLTDKHAALLVEGDFDGNGVLDEAFYVVNQGGNNYALVVFMNNGAQTFELKQLESLVEKGIVLAKPDVYSSACCVGGSLPDLHLMNEGIVSWHYKYNTAVIYYWQGGHFHKFYYAD